jgi:hypothetical protein
VDDAPTISSANQRPSMRQPTIRLERFVCDQRPACLVITTPSLKQTFMSAASDIAASGLQTRNGRAGIDVPTRLGPSRVRGQPWIFVNVASLSLQGHSDVLRERMLTSVKTPDHISPESWL